MAMPFGFDCAWACCVADWDGPGAGAGVEVPVSWQE
jgi:hypothetical protein